jgi:hypothetical protein
LDKFYVQLDDGMGPVMEMKWQQLKGTFSHETHLRRLAKFSSGASKLKVRQVPLSEKWQQALGKFEVLSFEWLGPKVGGEGAILYCRSCQKASLIQFYRRAGRDDPLVHVGVLNSLRDHSEDNRVKWAMFGLRASMPERFALLRHRFRPGHYELVFQDRQERVYLSRWGPAGVLLEDGDLQNWFERRCRDFRWCRTPWFRKIEHGDNPTIQGQSQRRDRFGARLWARTTGKLPHFWFRIWHLQAHNQILGVGACGLRPVDGPWLEEICSSYEMA